MSEETPKWLECWKAEDEKQPNRHSQERERWASRPTFILAAIGSAIGLGNFWRFPYLTYKYGGGFFFFPYLMCLFFMGIPLMLMELGLGQKIQRGDISVFRGIHPRLSGIGVASVFSAYIICFYYNVIISWSLVYLVSGFMSPLPWSNYDNPSFVPVCDPKVTSRAEQFFLIDVIRYFNNDCEAYKDGDPTQFSVPAFFGTFFVWLTCFFAVFKGVKSASCLVWFTVPLPAVLVLVMVIRGFSLPGAFKGVDQYLNGDNLAKVNLDATSVKGAKKGDVTFWLKQNPATTVDEAIELYEYQLAKMIDKNKSSQDTVWAAAAGQIFFSIGVCMGIMTSYGSYNHIRKPIIMDNCIIVFCNSGMSFIAGFAVWSVVGFLQETNNLAKSKTSSAGLAFIAYPSAIDEMPGKNAWAIVLGVTLYMLGIDSAFSMVEATSTVICDTPWGKKWPRMFVAFVLCFVGFLISIPFCTNWGFVLFDVIDHYLCAYLLIIVGILQCFGCGWGFDAEETMQRSSAHKKSLIYMTVSYWLITMIAGTIFVVVEVTGVGLLVTFALIILCCILPTYVLAGLPFGEFYDDILFCGVRRIALSYSMLGRADPAKRLWYENAFVFYWSILIKFGIPVVLWFILISTIKGDTAGYGGYAVGWQIAGIFVPFVGLVSFFVFLCINVYPEEYDKQEFDEEYFIKTEPQQRLDALNKANVKDANAKLNEAEMAAVGGAGGDNQTANEGGVEMPQLKRERDVDKNQVKPE